MKKFRKYLLENMSSIEKYTIRIEDNIIEVIPEYNDYYVPRYEISDLDIITVRDEIFRMYESRGQECKIFIDTLASEFFRNIVKEYLFLEEEYSLSVSEERVDALIKYMTERFLKDDYVEDLEYVSLKNINKYFESALNTVNFIF